VQNVSDVRYIEINIAEPLVTGPSRLEDEIAIAKFTSDLPDRVNFPFSIVP
jgi:hypothetical protein